MANFPGAGRPEESWNRLNDHKGTLNEALPDTLSKYRNKSKRFPCHLKRQQNGVWMVAMVLGVETAFHQNITYVIIPCFERVLTMYKW